MGIDARAIVDRRADIDPTAQIGPNVIIEGPVRIGPGTRVYPNAYISGCVTIGANCQIHPGALLGHLPQDFHFSGERTYLEIGDETTIREYATVHRGTQPESKTVIGSRCMLLGGSHVAHNCVLGEGVTMMNGSMLAGHVEVGRHATISGNAGAHQFVRIGELAMIGGLSKVTMDVPPFMTLEGKCLCVGVNVVGLRRQGYDADTRAELRHAYRLLYRSGKGFRESVAKLSEQVKTDAGRRLVAFLQAESRRGIAGGPRSPHRTNGIEA